MTEPSKTHIPELVRELLDEAGTGSGTIPLLAAAADEIMRLRERLEIGYAFVDGQRVACDNDAWDGIACRDETIKLLDAKIAEQKGALSESPNIGRWISVGERLPDDGQVVLCYWPAHGACAPASMQSLTYTNDSEVDGREAWLDIFNNNEDAPTHWMPLPEAPK